MKNLVSICIGLAVIGLVLGYNLSALWLWLALGLWSLAGQRSRWGWPASVSLVAFIGAAAYGIWQGGPAGWLLFSVVAALAAWDLDHFARRLQQTGQQEMALELQQAHLKRLALVAGLGLLLGGLALSLRIELNLGWACFLGLLTIIGLSRVIGFSGGRGD